MKNFKLTSPDFDDNELKIITECLKSGWVTQGPLVKRFEELFARRHQASYAVAVTSCTAALHLAALTLGLKSGDDVRLIDGRGNLFEGKIGNADPVSCTIRITGCTRDFENRNYRLHIAISPLKNPDRFEWFIEKSVEIGIDEITPVICKHTEKKGFKQERINNLIISAMKQSLKARLPVLNGPVAFSDFVSASKSLNNKMIAFCFENIERQKITSAYKGGDSVILIGPEGDFTPEEADLAIRSGFTPVHLGKSRLRTETAGIAACHSVYFINQ